MHLCRGALKAVYTTQLGVGIVGALEACNMSSYLDCEYCSYILFTRDVTSTLNTADQHQAIGTLFKSITSKFFMQPSCSLAIRMNRCCMCTASVITLTSVCSMQLLPIYTSVVVQLRGFGVPWRCAKESWFG